MLQGRSARWGRVFIPLGLFAVLAMVTTTLLWGQVKTSSSSSAGGQPKITWSQDHVEVTLSPGESTTKDLTFSAGLALQNIVIEPVPEIASFLTVRPSAIASVPASQNETVHFSFSVPAGATLGTYSGTVHVRNGTQTFPQTLKVVVNIWHQFNDIRLGLISYYPPTWGFSHIDLTHIGFSPTGKPVDASKEYVGDIMIEIIQNPSGLDLDSFYAILADVNLFKNSATFTRIEINGAPAVKFVDVFGMIPTDLVAINRGHEVIEISDVGQLHETDGILDQIANSIR